MANRGGWIKFYPDDWVSDVNLMSCKLQYQAVFLKLFPIMMRSNPYGYLLQNGCKVVPNCSQSDPKVFLKQLQSVCKVNLKTLQNALEELEDKGVLRRDEIGLYNERMVRDQRKRDEAHEHGVKGGNPNITGKGVKGRVNLDTDADKDTDADAEKRLTPPPLSLPEFENIPQDIIDTLNLSWGASFVTGTLLQHIGENLKGFPWMKEAIIEAADHNGRSWSYLEKIITNWRDNGGPTDNKSKVDRDLEERRRITREKWARDAAREEAERRQA